MRSYIPQRESLLKAWAINFAALITAAPETYGLSAGNATTIQDSVDDFSDAYDLANNPATRTGPTVSDKDAKRVFMLQIVRPFSQQVRNNSGVSNENKLALGLTIRDTVPTPIAAPVTQPLLSILAATPLEHTIRFSDAASPDKRAKPFGVKGLLLFRFVGDNAPADYSDWHFVGLATKNPFPSSFASGDATKRAQYVARWVNGNGKVGPWSAVSEAVVID